jgi:ATP-dependent DNA helicase RecQ
MDHLMSAEDLAAAKGIQMASFSTRSTVRPNICSNSQRTLERETREIARLDQVLTLAAHDGCQTAFLAAHFGEELPHPCGHCSWCENGGRPAKLLPPASVHLDEERLRRAADLRQEIPDLAAPRALARFLTGLPSPRLTRAKLKSHPLFGAFAHVPFADVLRRVEEGEEGGRP